MSKWGFVYCLASEAVPGMYKIGRTEKPPFERCKQISSATGVPIPYEVMFYIEVPDPHEVERYFHDKFDGQRVQCNREFFSVDLHRLYDLFEDYARGECGAFAVTSAYIYKCIEEAEKSAIEAGEIRGPRREGNGESMV